MQSQSVGRTLLGRICVIHQPVLFRSCGRMAGRGALVATAVRNDDAPVVEFDSNR